MNKYRIVYYKYGYYHAQVKTFFGWKNISDAERDLAELEKVIYRDAKPVVKYVDPYTDTGATP